MQFSTFRSQKSSSHVAGDGEKIFHNKSCQTHLGFPIPHNFGSSLILLKLICLSKHLKKYEKLDFSANRAKMM